MCYHSLLPTDGLPLIRWERGVEDDLIAGKDFLSVLMDLPAVKESETTTDHPRVTVTLPTSIQLEHYSSAFTPVIRESRSTHFTPSIQKPDTAETVLMPTQPLSEISTLNPQQSSEINNRRIVGISFSSSVSKTHRRLPSRTETPKAMEIKQTIDENFDDRAFLSSEDRPSLVAEANRQEFSVEEPEPITKNADMMLNEELPANVQAIPVIKKLSDFEKTSELLKELSQDKLKDKLPPFHHTVIFHDNPTGEQMGSRSVSYSTVIQTVPGETVVKRWRKPSMTQEESESKPTQNSKYDSKDYDESLEKNKEDHEWESSEGSTGETIEPTERNWGTQQKAYMSKERAQGIYGVPEENYEVDEAVSVQTNGRIHGVQLSASTMEDALKPTAKSKNGYVIEGRKERRYRVEERTPDGFIVGEFGIVNRDDGLLRGVRYTAEETINPKLIYDTLMKFLSL